MSNGRHSRVRRRAGTMEITNCAVPAVPYLLGPGKRPCLLTIAGAHVGDVHKLTRPRTVVGRGASATIRILDDDISREHVEFVVDGDKVMVRDLGSRNGTLLNGAPVVEYELGEGDKVAIGSTTIFKFSYQDGLDENFHKRFFESATRDAMSGALKREFFVERLEGEVAFSVRDASPLALILWDLDRFKSVNDVHGHLAGDQMIAAAARAVRPLIRRDDIFARYGGEEFVLACRATDADRAIGTAERLRVAVAETRVSIAAASLRVTASFGIAVCPKDGSSVSALFAAADAALYRAKANGRNRVEIS